MASSVMSQGAPAHNFNRPGTGVGTTQRTGVNHFLSTQSITVPQLSLAASSTKKAFKRAPEHQTTAKKGSKATTQVAFEAWVNSICKYSS